MSRATFYVWQRSEQTVHKRSDEELLPLIRIIFREHKRRYGARRIGEELHDTVHACSVRRVRKLWKTQGRKVIQPKSTDSNQRLGYSPNLLFDAAEPDGMNQVWVGDITYIRLRGGTFCYLAVLMDRFRRRIIGSNFRTDMTESPVLKVLGRAIRERHQTDGLIHHTDRGGQYVGTKYRAILGRTNIHQSMSRAADCYDNAFMESCFGTLKRELDMTEYNSPREAHAEIAQYIRYYNCERKHSGIEYVKSSQVEALINQPE